MSKRVISISITLCLLLMLLPIQVVQASSSTAGNRLTGVNSRLYNLLKTEITKVAIGERESTSFQFSVEELGLSNLSWSLNELGVQPIMNSTGTSFTQDTWSAIENAVLQKIGLSIDITFWQSLMGDCPFELYWMQKEGDKLTNQYGDAMATFSTSSSHLFFDIHNLIATFNEHSYLQIDILVSEEYAKMAEGNQHYYYLVDQSKTRSAAQSAANARHIVEENAGKSDYEKLVAYKDAICNLVSYDDNAAAQGSIKVGVSPFNLISVFDNNTETNVVCEGYAKAFQYLCELSSFQGNVVSYLIEGMMTNASGQSAKHAWNHVKIGENVFLVDVTTCDTAVSNRTFLKAPDEQTAEQYRFLMESGGYTTYYDIENYYGDSNVTNLCEDDYSPLSSTKSDASVVNVALNKTALSLTVGASETLVAKIFPDSEKLTWATMDSSVAIVKDGVVTAMGVGKTAILAIAGKTFSQTTQGGSAVSKNYASCSVTVTDTNTNNVLGVSGFQDVDPSAYYADAVRWAVAQGVTNGVSATNFAPDDICTRGQVVTFLWRAKGSPEPKTAVNPFTDVDSHSAFYKAILWAAENGITAGTSATTFSPTNLCTRGHVITFLWRAQGKPTPTSSRNSSFADSFPEGYYTNAVRWGDSVNLLTATGEMFTPFAPCPRADIVTYLYRELYLNTVYSRSR